MHMLFVMRISIAFQVCGIVFSWSYIIRALWTTNMHIDKTLLLFLDLIYPAIHINLEKNKNTKKPNGGESSEQPVKVIDMGSVHVSVEPATATIFSGNPIDHSDDETTQEAWQTHCT